MKLKDSLKTLKAAADLTRLRLLALLAAGEATVSELQEVLVQSQPRVSRHLRLLCESDLAEKFRDGHYVYYRLNPDTATRGFVAVVLSQLDAEDKTLKNDQKKMSAARQIRFQQAWTDTKAFVAAGRTSIPGLSNTDDLAAALSDLTGDFGELLDIGVGTGAVLCHLAPRSAQATGVDISPALRVVARTRIRDAALNNCTVRQGDMHNLPFDDMSFDTVLLDQVLSLTDRPRVAISEAARVLKPNGRVLVLDRIAPVKSNLEQDYTLEGLAENQLAVMFAESGLRFGKRRDLTGRLPGFALLEVNSTLEMGLPQIKPFAA
ncbi:MAG: metalloregulator ArsR/SmtB family transcription factor [Pseudomonadota bacterium]|nr:metalloregulator ArsR/SmtB family transcription factor [Pseudomonadota bacterium]